MTPSEYKGTAPQEAQADPQDHSCHDECACQNGGHPMPDFVVPQTEGECPDCKGDRAGYKASCPTCSGTGKEGEK